MAGSAFHLDARGTDLDTKRLDDIGGAAAGCAVKLIQGSGPAALRGQGMACPLVVHLLKELQAIWACEGLPGPASKWSQLSGAAELVEGQDSLETVSPELPCLGGRKDLGRPPA